MTYRVLVRPAGTGFDAWAPDLPGCATTGATEDEAVRNIRKAIQGRLDLERVPEGEITTVREFDVSVTASPVERIAQPVDPETLPGPVPINGLTQLYMGGIVFALGVIGLVFYLTIEPQSSPALLFLPMMVLAAGVLGLFFGALSLDAKPRAK